MERNEFLKSSYSITLDDAFAIEKDALEKLVILLSERIGAVTIRAECVDHIVREFADLASLLQFENTKSNRIVGIRINASSSDDFTKRGSIEFRDKWYHGGIAISIDAKDDVVTRLRNDMLDIVAGTKAWYSALSKIDIWLWATVLYGVFWLSLAVFAAISTPQTANPSPQSQKGYGLLIVIGFCFCWFGTAYLLHRLRKLFFPHGNFLIGQGVGRYDTMEKWRWGFIIAFIASFAAGLLQFAMLLPLNK
jgi:hypothetical protein